MVDYVRKHFSSTAMLDYAVEVERITTAKKNNLILNVDGCMAVTMVVSLWPVCVCVCVCLCMRALLCLF